MGSIIQAALRTVARILKPLAKVGIQSAKRVAKDHGIKALKDIADVQNVKQVLKQRGKTALNSFGQSSIDQLASGIKSTRKSEKASVEIKTSNCLQRQRKTIQKKS